MNKKKLAQIASVMLGGVMSLTALSALTACGPKQNKKDSIVLMAEEMSGNFNPFYATSGADMEVIGMTQIGMLSTDSTGEIVAGDDETTVVKAFDQKIVDAANGEKETVYTFVIKNGLKFSDGKPLTMNDVMFNMYEYLDPVYTGSSTMYSTKIKGLTRYRTQQNYSDGGSTAEEQNSNTAAGYATVRILELLQLYQSYGLIEGSQNSYKMTEAQMKDVIKDYSVSDGYKDAVATVAEQATNTDATYSAMLQADYELTLKTFKEELNSDFNAAKESFDLTTAPYQEHAAKLESDIFKFFLYEGYITPEYEKVMGKDNKLKIVRFTGESIAERYTTKEEAINFVHKDKVENSLHEILSYWGTAGTLATQYQAEATDVLLHNSLEGDELAYPTIEGIKSLGHNTTQSTVTVAGTNYKVAQNHNADGTTTSADEYDVLQITVDGTDPKAIYNFAFTVAPAHYYTNGAAIDIKNNNFGVKWADSEFQSKTIQSKAHQEIPVGAGPFKATNSDNADDPKGSDFWNSNIVYFKANDNFMFEVKAKKVRLQVVSSTNALDKLEKGEVDYVTPQFTKANSERLKGMASKGFKQLDTWQLGYGYIGINAGKVPNINIRKAIMSAMQTSLALGYYETGTCQTIDWPMSRVNWAYPYEADGTTSKANGHDYTQFTTVAAAKVKIQNYMDQAGVSAGSSDLKIRFTIAGASITEHPTYAVFKQASEILNEMGWDVEVKADSQALTKLSTGSLAVWAAAWGSTVDPDMYQVYHKNSSATSVYSWGYREIKGDQSTYATEYGIISELSEIIDDARSMMDRATRTPLYEQAMSLVLDLAVELPVYQRKTLFAYNTKTIKGLSENVNPYSSPLEKIWELEMV